jgi:hypothetical protein
VSGRRPVAPRGRLARAGRGLPGPVLALALAAALGACGVKAAPRPPGAIREAAGPAGPAAGGPAAAAGAAPAAAPPPGTAGAEAPAASPHPEPAPPCEGKEGSPCR